MCVKNSLTSYLSETHIGDPQVYRNMIVLPLIAETSKKPEYLTLGQAALDKLLKVQEVNESGSVPELKVKNRAKLPVLILEGEELAGAKQNRIVNTSILLPAESTTIVPVSCTEQGRWHYTSPEAFDSGTPLMATARAVHKTSVMNSYRLHRKATSDQGKIWAAVEELSCSAGVRSPTSSMRDVYFAKRINMDEYGKAFRRVEGQTGLAVIICGMSVGFDLVSRSDAYARLHERLLTSYSMDALVRRDDKSHPCQPMLKAKRLLYDASQATEQDYDSVGLGRDHRFGGPQIVGSALRYEEVVIHTGFFRRRENLRAARRMEDFEQFPRPESGSADAYRQSLEQFRHLETGEARADTERPPDVPEGV